MPSCAVQTCKNTSATVGNLGIIFHPFPTNEKESLEWFIKCKQRGKKRASAADRICSEHFQLSDYKRNITPKLQRKPSSPKLKYKATPTLNLPYINIRPAEARKILPPSLARQLFVSSHQKGENGRKQFGPSMNEKRNLQPSQSKEFDYTRCISTDSHCQALLWNIFKNEEFVDVILVAENKSLKAHKAVLSQASNYFRQLLSYDTSASPDSEVKVTDVEYEDLINLITFIYRGKIHVKNRDLGRLYEAAKILEVKSLLDELERIKVLSDRCVSTRGHKVCSRDCKEMKYFTNTTIKKNKPSRSQHLAQKLTKRCTSELKNWIVSALYLLY